MWITWEGKYFRVCLEDTLSRVMDTLSRVVPFCPIGGGRTVGGQAAPSRSRFRYVSRSMEEGAIQPTSAWRLVAVYCYGTARVSKRRPRGGTRAERRGS